MAQIIKVLVRRARKTCAFDFLGTEELESVIPSMETIELGDRNDNSIKKRCNSFTTREFYPMTKEISAFCPQSKSTKTKKMKIQMTTIAVALATSLIAYAEPPEGKEGKRKGPGRSLPQEIVEKFDANKDGKLDKEERKAAMEARKAEMLKKYDKDGNGELSEEEKKAVAADRKAELIKRHDKDGNGELSDEEKKTARAEMEKRRGPRGEGKGKGKGAKGKKGPRKPKGE